VDCASAWCFSHPQAPRSRRNAAQTPAMKNPASRAGFSRERGFLEHPLRASDRAAPPARSASPLSRSATY
jgi:hypothetical protein